jgi:hypothetical protein
LLYCYYQQSGGCRDNKYHRRAEVGDAHSSDGCRTSARRAVASPRCRDPLKSGRWTPTPPQKTSCCQLAQGPRHLAYPRGVKTPKPKPTPRLFHFACQSALPAGD